MEVTTIISDITVAWHDRVGARSVWVFFRLKQWLLMMRSNLGYRGPDSIHCTRNAGHFVHAGDACAFFQLKCFMTMLQVIKIGCATSVKLSRRPIFCCMRVIELIFIGGVHLCIVKVS